MRAFTHAVLAGTVLALSLDAAAAEPVREVCALQVTADVQSRFGQQVSGIEFSFFTVGLADDDDLERGYAFVRTTACPGYHTYYLHTNEFTCRIASHYGSLPHYESYLHSDEGC